MAPGAGSPPAFWQQLHSGWGWQAPGCQKLIGEKAPDWAWITQRERATEKQPGGGIALGVAGTAGRPGQRAGRDLWLLCEGLTVTLEGPSSSSLSWVEDSCLDGQYHMLFLNLTPLPSGKESHTSARKHWDEQIQAASPGSLSCVF